MAKKRIDLGPEGPEWFPWIIWLYKHGWEDPDWGTTPIGQMMIAAAIHEMAGRMGDGAARRDIQRSTAGVIAKVSKTLAGPR